MLEQSSTGRTYTRDAYAPVRRDAHAEVVKYPHANAFPFFQFSKNLENAQLTPGLLHRRGGAARPLGAASRRTTLLPGRFDLLLLLLGRKSIATRFLLA